MNSISKQWMLSAALTWYLYQYLVLMPIVPRSVTIVCLCFISVLSVLPSMAYQVSMNSTCVHVFDAPCLCTSSTLDTLSIFSCKFVFFLPVFPDCTMPRAARNRRRVSNTVNPACMELGQLLALPR